MSAAMLKHTIDIDSHEMIPAHLMEGFFGEPGRVMGAMMEERQRLMNDYGTNSMVHPGVEDVMEITPETAWNSKGPSAPAAIDLRRRPELLDAMGVETQLIFPTFGLGGLAIMGMSDANFKFSFGMEPPCDLRELGLSMVQAHNDWVIHGLDVDRERVRVVALVPTQTVSSMLSEAKRLVEGGARVLWIPAADPPAGTSPANEALDPFWSLAEEFDVPIVLHLGTEFGFLDQAWRDAPAFVGDFNSIELPTLDKGFLSTFHFAAENFLVMMVLGGVFERHPRLRFGVIECAAHWVGPMAERMDLIVNALHRDDGVLSMPPSAYVARNVRVTPFWFEPVDAYLRQYPHLQDVYCYSSDFPHNEGGIAPKQKFYDKVAPLGDEMVDKFFRSNAKLLVP
jgi:predicted TIM-barrel fold metal-dependent hydrolase